MGVVTKEYLDALPDIYRHILAAFPQLEPYRNAGDALAYQTLYEGLRNQFSSGKISREPTLGEIIQACEQMAQGGAVIIRLRMFVCPTQIGEEIIAALTGTKPSERHVPDFPTPNQQ